MDRNICIVILSSVVIVLAVINVKGEGGSDIYFVEDNHISTFLADNLSQNVSFTFNS